MVGTWLERNIDNSGGTQVNKVDETFGHHTPLNDLWPILLCVVLGYS